MFDLHHVPMLGQQALEGVLQFTRQAIHTGQQRVRRKQPGQQGLQAVQRAAGEDDHLFQKGFQHLAIRQRYRMFVMQQQGDPVPARS